MQGALEDQFQLKLLESELERQDEASHFGSRSERSPDFLARAMRSPDFLARAMRSPKNAYLVRTM